MPMLWHCADVSQAASPIKALIGGMRVAEALDEAFDEAFDEDPRARRDRTGTACCSPPGLATKGPFEQRRG